MSYHEAMAYLTGRRHFILGLEKEGILAEGMAQKVAIEVSDFLKNVLFYSCKWIQGTSYQPTWFERSSSVSVGDEKKSFAQQILQKEVFGKSWALDQIMVKIMSTFYDF